MFFAVKNRSFFLYTLINNTKRHTYDKMKQNIDYLVKIIIMHKHYKYVETYLC